MARSQFTRFSLTLTGAGTLPATTAVAEPLSFLLIGRFPLLRSSGRATATIFVPQSHRQSILHWRNCRSGYPSGRLGSGPRAADSVFGPGRAGVDKETPPWS